jgi:hypothetical protein
VIAKTTGTAQSTMVASETSISRLVYSKTMPRRGDALRNAKSRGIPGAEAHDDRRVDREIDDGRGSAVHAPASMTRSTCAPSASLIDSASFSGSVLPGSISVDERIGSESSCSNACATAWSGTRTPIVLRLGCWSRRGTSRVARRTNV